MPPNTSTAISKLVYGADMVFRPSNPALKKHFHTHCVVMTGHLPFAYWPKYKRLTGERKAVTFCTCGCFGQHVECEHQYFALALTAGPGELPDLANAPFVSKRGRKRKLDD